MHDIGVGNGFLDGTRKAQATKEQTSGTILN